MTLDVLSVQGRLVQRLVDRLYGPGRWSVEWSGQRADTRPVPAGVYVYRLQAGSFRTQRKMVVF